MPATDALDWIADRERLLILAWTPELASGLAWERPYAETLAGELHTALVTAGLHGLGEAGFLRLVALSGSGMEPEVERRIASRFHAVTVKLARAAIRRADNRSVAGSFPYLAAFTVGDTGTSPGHRPLDGVILPQDHAFWTRWHPPLGMDCRCSVVLENERSLARRGPSLTSNADLAEREKRLAGAWPAAFEPLLDFRR